MGKNTVVRTMMIPCVEIRVKTYYDSLDRDYFHNKQFKTPGPAAKHWALYKATEWADKKVWADWKERARYQDYLYEKFLRRAKPVFERLLKSPT